MLTIGYLWEEYEKFWFFIMCHEWLNVCGHSLLSGFDEKITFAGYERHRKGNSETSLSCPKISLPCRVSHENGKYILTLDIFSLSSQQLVPNYFLYPSKGSDVYLQEIFNQFTPSKHYSPPFGDRWDPSKVVEKTDCRELFEVHRNVIDVKSIAFLMILLAPEDSFVTLHKRWHKKPRNRANWRGFIVAVLFYTFSGK